MACGHITAPEAPIYLFNHDQSSGEYSIWKLDLANPNLFQKIDAAGPRKTAPGQQLCAVGNYLLSYNLESLTDDPSVVSFELHPLGQPGFDPLNAAPIQRGTWKKFKFWQFFDHYTWDPTEFDFLQLVPMTGYVMAFMPTAARGGYMLWNFDPAPDTPLSADPLPNAMGPQDAFAEIGLGSELLPMGNYVLEWKAATSSYRVWNFDPQNTHPLSMPPISSGERPTVGPGHKLVAMGEYILELDTNQRPARYALWRFDPMQSDPFVGPIAQGALPDGFGADRNIVPYQPLVPIDAVKASQPGTMDFMRSNVEHVVVYMLESRTMDNVLGWLHQDDSARINYINAEAPFEGNSYSNSNCADGKQYPVFQFENGKLSEDFVLASPAIDPFHATSDCIAQQFSGGFSSYLAGEAADMGGFVSNNLSGEAMASFGPEQLPVLYGLAASYGVSDMWFSPMPGGTIANRGFALSGSNSNVIVNCEGEPQYSQFAEGPRRQPIWKVLQNNGITDWKLYHSVIWEGAPFTYQLYLRNQLPSVDAMKDLYAQPLDYFFADAKNGALPRFSFVEPAWIAPTGATSYHPGAMGDMVPGEVALKKLYEALRDSPQWEKTALVITFSKGGGLYDHVPTPKGQPAWPRDEADGFKYDVLGPRVPTIVVSPHVQENTVFRSPEEQPFEATSLLSTLLDWCGIPRARWGLGDRAQVAPTFEAVFELSTPRSDKPDYDVPYDSKYPAQKMET